jgi:hypothetical protein
MVEEFTKLLERCAVKDLGEADTPTPRGRSTRRSMRENGALRYRLQRPTGALVDSHRWSFERSFLFVFTGVISMKRREKRLEYCT